MPEMTIEVRKALRGYILRALCGASPNFLPETTLKLSLHTLQALPPADELVREINYLRDRGFLESKDVGRPGKEIFLHRLTPEGYELVTGEDDDDHIWIA